MSSCINIKSAEFRALQKRSGLSTFMLDVLVSNYGDEHNGEWPQLDELPGVDSGQSIKEELNLRKDNSTSIENLLEVTGTEDLDSALIKVNDTYRDKDINFTKISDQVVLTIEDRPSPFKTRATESIDIDSASSLSFISNSLDDLAKRFGIQTKLMTTREMKQAGLLDSVPEGVQAAAFIYNGDIYVNADIASINDPVHEMMHVLMGSIKFSEPDLYYQLVQSARDLDNYDEYAEMYQHRLQSDIDEEVFVEEYSKMLSGMPSKFDDLDPNIIYKVNYNISRTLDTILNGDNSVRVLPVVERFTSSFAQLGEKVNAKNMKNEHPGYMDSAYLHRIQGNIASELLKSGELEEICD